MWILKRSKDLSNQEYGIFCQRLFPLKEIPTPFGSASCTVPIKGSTTPHSHTESETFFITRGQGLIHIEEESEEVEGGDIIFIPSGSRHALENICDKEELEFISIWWEEEKQKLALPKRTLITAAPPTPNGDLHVGHLSGPYLAADILNRFLKTQGVESFLMSGSDDHQSYVALKAKRLGKEPAAVAEHYAASIQNSLLKAKTEYDYFLKPHKSDEYAQFCQAFFLKLYENGKIEKRDSLSLFCDPCGRYLFEAHVRGGCPHCGNPTNGNGCETCGRTNDCLDLVGPQCNHCGENASQKPLTRFYFPLENYRSQLSRFHLQVEMNPRLRSFTDALFSSRLPDISLSHIAHWGIQVPLSDFQDQILFVWFEMVAGYLFASKAMSPDHRWESFWKDKDSRIVQFFGFDNSFYYTVFIPAVLLAFDPEIRLPWALLTNEFYRFEGSKFSTSRNHAVWSDELLSRNRVSDVRLFLAYDRPEIDPTNFTFERLDKFIDAELLGKWQPWLENLSSFNLETPQNEDRFLSGFEKEIEKNLHPSHFSLNRVVRLLSSLVDTAQELPRPQQLKAAQLVRRYLKMVGAP